MKSCIKNNPTLKSTLKMSLNNLKKISLLILLLRIRRKRKEKVTKRRKFWARDIFAKREMHNEYHHSLSGDRVLFQ